MTEKRSDYRKQIKHKKNKNLLHTIKSAFDNSDDTVDVNPSFKRDPEETAVEARKTKAKQQQRRQSANQTTRDKTAQAETTTDKALRLKKKLNRAILIVIALIALVLLALFHL